MTSDAQAEHAGPYRLLEHLGEGGMGVVRRALGQDDREVALKLLRPELAASADFRRRLAREVETMRRVRSPYVAEVLDADVDATRPYVVTRFIRGRPLDDEVRARGPLSGEPLRRVAAGLADALVAIHGAGVVHRDLKPNNVMLVDGSPVVIDFGIAHAVDATRLTRAGQVVGTPGYMGPEIIDGVAPGPAADVYGWAATVTFAASGHSPFGSGSLESVLTRIATGVPDLGGVPPGLLPHMRAALDRDPARRPSAVELARRMRELDLDVAPPPAAVTTAVDRQPAENRQLADGRRPTADRESVGCPPAGGQVRRPPLGAYKLLAYLSIVALSAVCAMLPFLTSLAVLGAAWYLRAGDATARSRGTPAGTTAELMRASARAKVRATFLIGPTLAYAILVAAAVGTALFARGTFGGDAGSGATTRWTAFAFAYVTLAGPRAPAPRRQLVRLLSALARGRRATAYTGLVACVLTAAAVAAACVVTPTWWPLPSPYEAVGGLTGHLKDLLGDLR